MRKYVLGVQAPDLGEEAEEDEEEEDDGPGRSRGPLSKWELKALEKGELRFDNPRGYIDSTTPRTPASPSGDPRARPAPGRRAPVARIADAPSPTQGRSRCRTVRGACLISPLSLRLTGVGIGIFKYQVRKAAPTSCHSETERSGVEESKWWPKGMVL